MIKRLSIIFLLSTAIGCNESNRSPSTSAPDENSQVTGTIAGEQQEPNSKDICSGEANIYLNEKEGRRMIHLFDSIYRKKATVDSVDALSKNTWVDGSVIKGFYNTLYDSANSYTGVRVHFAANLKAGNFNGTKKYKSEFLVTPTIDVENDGYFWHKDVWDKKITPVPVSPIPTFENYNLSMKDGRDKKTKFRQEYREESQLENRASAKYDAFSLSVWLDKCIFQVMHKILIDSPKVYDGFMLYAAAYEKKKVPSQKYNHQTTIILVPTKKVGMSHEEDWDILNTIRYKSGRLVLNHGELCPDNCPPLKED